MNTRILIAGALGLVPLCGQGLNNDLFQTQRELQTLITLPGGRVLDEGFGNRRCAMESAVRAGVNKLTPIAPAIRGAATRAA